MIYLPFMKLLEKIPSSLMAVTVVMAALAPLVFVVARDSQGMLMVWMGIYLAVGVIAGLGAFFFERSKKSRSEGFSKGLEQNAASAEGVKDPNKIAQIDHMRKEFQRGIDIYKRHGKDLYSLPWFVVAGESGSGKTEALRRSEIGFPDKLQDKWQGSGGTLSMHWWFTNKAVILDTAGRLFVQDGSDGDAGQSQWVSFLQMLRKHRPDCPINGLILVIPATRLLAHQDPETEAASMARLDANTGQISRQMETLQAELGIRFPVYILISKTDKITGFREFFAGIDRADERYQMLGWSNPAPLGENFNPQSVADYIQSVSDRLKRRMMSGLRNPEPESAQGLRIDEVDALYSFPAAFASMAPKLSRYLKQVFAADEWSAKPPFLRGIYFTSALQQGRVLDEAVAKALGIPLESMEGAESDDAMSLTKNRTYFVRDLFLEKIFKEKGLVTKADKIRSEISGWKLWVPACFVIGLLLFGAMGWFTNRPGTERDHWSTLSKFTSSEKGRLLSPLATISQGKGVWSGAANGKSQLLNVLEELGGDVKKRPYFGWMFVPAQWVDGDLNLERKNAYSSIIAAVFGELVKDISPSVMMIRAEDMKESHWKAIKALLLLKYGKIQENELLIPGSDDQPKVEVVVADLVTPLGMNDSQENGGLNVKLLSSVVSEASTLSNAGFSDSFAAELSDLDLVEPIKELFKSGTPDRMEDFKKAIEAISAKYGKVLNSLKPGGPTMSERVILSLADDIRELRRSYPNQIGEFENNSSAHNYDANGGEKSKKVDPKEDFRNWIKKNDQKGIMGLGELNKSDASSKLGEDAEKLLLDKSKLLNDLLSALSPAGDDGRFTADEIDLVLKSMESNPKEGDVDAGKVGRIREWWFNQHFFPQKFAGYLRFPLVSDGELAKDDNEMYVAIRLISVAQKLGYNPGHIRKIDEVAKALFDCDNLDAQKPLPVRMCRINPGDTGHQTVILHFQFRTSKKEATTFNTGDANTLAPIDVKMDEDLNIRVEGSEAIQASSGWSVIRWWLDAGPQGWLKKFGGKIGMTLSVQTKEAQKIPESSSWPKIKDFTLPRR